MISTAENAGGSELVVTYDHPGRKAPRKKKRPSRRDVEAEAQKAALREMPPYPQRR